VFVIFLVSGFWHGANWTFIVWGGLHALLFIPSVLTKNNRKFTKDIQLNRYFLPSIGDVLRILSTFVVVSFCWVFFRADSLNVAFLFIQKIIVFESYPISFLNPYDNQPLGIEFIYLVVFIFVEYLLATKIIKIYSKNRYKGIIIDAVLLLVITISVQIGSNLSFIYFQF
jgi:hypothetical protein